MKPYRLAFLSLLLLCSTAIAAPAKAQIKIITATGEYRMGDNDTRTDAKRLALLDAKRLALEKAGTYIESITEVKSFDLTKEEIRAYTAGIVEVVEQATKDIIEGSTHIIRMDVTTKIDTDVVARQIDALRKNEDVKSKLLQAEIEVSKLRNELEAKTHELAAARSKAEIKDVAQRRGQIIARIEAEQLVMRVAPALIGVQRHVSITGSPHADTLQYARSLLEQALFLDPNYADAHFWLGALLLLERDFDGVIAEYRTALRLMPEDKHINYASLGVALQLKGDLDGAIVAFRTAVRLKPDDPTAHRLLGDALQEKGDLDGAIAAFRTAVRLEPDDPTVHHLLGDVLQEKGDLDGAIGEWWIAFRIGADDATAHHALGIELVGKGLTKRAAREFREALRLAPDTPDGRKLAQRARARLHDLGE